MSFIDAYGQSLKTAYQRFPDPVKITGYQSNNQYENFPPKMNDGRAVLASWQPGAVVNEKLLQENSIQSNWQYRRYLTDNSQSICKNLLHDAMNDVGYSIRNENPDLNRVFESPKVYKSVDEPISHTQAQFSDLQSIYLTREQLYEKMSVPTYEVKVPK